MRVTTVVSACTTASPGEAEGWGEGASCRRETGAAPGAGRRRKEAASSAPRTVVAVADRRAPSPRAVVAADAEGCHVEMAWARAAAGTGSPKRRALGTRNTHMYDDEEERARSLDSLTRTAHRVDDTTDYLRRPIRIRCKCHQILKCQTTLKRLASILPRFSAPTRYASCSLTGGSAFGALKQHPMADDALTLLGACARYAAYLGGRGRTN